MAGRTPDDGEIDVIAASLAAAAIASGLQVPEAMFRRELHDVVVMADCGSLADAVAAREAGADVLGTTLAGYSGEREKTPGPDFEVVDQIVALDAAPVFVEGRVHSPAQAAEAMRRGAWAVVVGTAITHPATITGWFADAVAGATA